MDGFLVGQSVGHAVLAKEEVEGIGFELALIADWAWTTGDCVGVALADLVRWVYSSTVSNQFDVRPMVEECSAIPMARLRVLQAFDEVHLPDMRRGIIFVFAGWSGPALVGLRRFTKAIQSLDTRSLDLVVLDTECLTEESAAELFGTPSFTTGGWGETMWVRDGQVVARVLAHTAPEPLMVQYTRELLQDQTA